MHVLRSAGAFLCGVTFLCAPARAGTLAVDPEALAVLEKIYSGDLEGAREDAARLEQERPEHPLGYLLEADAMWWKIWCRSAEFKYGMTFPRHRAKLAADRRYLELAAKASWLAEAQIAEHETPEMQFYAGMGDALAARLYGLRGEGRNTARAGVRARDYYIDTLSAAARILRFFMGIPGGSKRDGIRQLQHAIDDGVLAQGEARFYLAINLHNYDQQYERALEIIGPLVEKYPSNPLFQLARGDLYVRLGRKPQAMECYQAAEAASIRDPECAAHVQELARASLAAIGGFAGPAAQ